MRQELEMRNENVGVWRENVSLTSVAGISAFKDLRKLYKVETINSVSFNICNSVDFLALYHKRQRK